MLRLITLVCSFVVGLSSQAQLKQDFSSRIFLGSDNKHKGQKLLSYKDGYVMITLLETKTDKNKVALATVAKDSSGKYLTGFYYNQYTYNKNDEEIYDYAPQDFIRLKGGHYMVCGKGYVVELDENLKHSSNFIGRKDFYYYSLSEGKGGQVIVAYSDSYGKLGTLVFHSEGSSVNYKTSNYNPSGDNKSYTTNLVLNDSMYAEFYNYYDDDERVTAVALKSYASIVRNHKADNFRWEYAFEKYSDIRQPCLDHRGNIVGIGSLKNEYDSFELFVFDPRQKKVINHINIGEELSKGNVMFDGSISLHMYNKQYLVSVLGRFLNEEQADQSKWSWMINRRRLPYVMVFDPGCIKTKSGFLVDKSQKSVLSFDYSSGAFSLDPLNNRLFFTPYSYYYKEDYLLIANPKF